MGSLVPSALPSNLISVALDAWCKGLGRSVPSEALTAKIWALWEQLAPVGILEELLCERVIVAYVALSLAEAKLGEVTASEHRHSSGLYWDRRVSGAQRRYLGCVKELAGVRRR